MSTGTPERADRIGATTEMDLASRLADGSLSGHTTMWIVAATGRGRSATRPEHRVIP